MPPRYDFTKCLDWKCKTDCFKVYDAAAKGNLPLLEDLLNHRSVDEVKRLLSTLTHACTPLLMACRNAHLHVVRYFLEKCQADAEQVGRLTVYNCYAVYEDATPLWCAARCGNLLIVKILVEHGVSVNNTTTANSDALRAACIAENYDIVKYLVEQGADVEITNQQGHTCLMAACAKADHSQVIRYLLECGADVNRRSITGNTAMHACANAGNLEMLKLLVQHGAKIEANEDGVTPLLLAAAWGWLSSVNYLFEIHRFSKQDKIDALELMGAAYTDIADDFFGGLRYWRIAMHLKYKDNVPKKPAHKSHISNYLNITEKNSLQQLVLIDDPEEVEMQALLIRERILGLWHPAYLTLLRMTAYDYVRRNNFERPVKLLLYLLDIEQCINPLSFKTKWILQSLADLFVHAQDDTQKYPAADLLRDMSLVFDRALTELNTAVNLDRVSKESGDLLCHIGFIEMVALHLLCSMSKIQVYLTDKEEFLVKKAAYDLVNIFPTKSDVFSPLHIACSDVIPDDWEKMKLKSQRVKAVELLLDVGACPNALDSHNNTPLIVAAKSRPFDENVFYMLLKKGAHLDFCNDENECALHLIPPTVALDIDPLQHSSLQCLCARVIIKDKIPYTDLLNKSLCSFVDLH